MRCERSLAQQLCSAAATYCRSATPLEHTYCALPPWLPQTARLLQTLSEAPEQFVALNNLRDNPGATHSVRFGLLYSLLLCQALPEPVLPCSLNASAEELARVLARHRGEDIKDRRPEQVCLHILCHAYARG